MRQNVLRATMMVALAMVVVGLTACVVTLPSGESTTIVSSAQPEEASPEGTSMESKLSGVLTGTVTYRERMALPAGSVIEVQLRDVSLADAPAVIIAGQTITTAGENVPIPFTLDYDPAQIDQRYSYALSARITINGQLRWINTDNYAVLTRDAPLTGVEVVVHPVQ